MSSAVQVRAVSRVEEAVLNTEEGWLRPGRLWRKMENGVEDSPLPVARSKVALLIKLLTWAAAIAAASEAASEVKEYLSNSR